MDHTGLWGIKHTAIQEAIKNGQKAIYNIGTGETFTLPGEDKPQSLAEGCLVKLRRKLACDGEPAVPDWAKKGEIRLQCRKCGKEHDEIAVIPPGWIKIQRVRSFGRATSPVGFDETANKYGDTVHDWQTHFASCPDCQGDSAPEAPAEDKTIVINLGDYTETGVENVPKGWRVELRDYDPTGDWAERGADAQGNAYEYLSFPFDDAEGQR